MSKHSNSLCAGGTRARLICGSVVALLLAACAGHTQQKTDKAHEAAIYNVQLGVAYMNQGDLERAKEKLDRALAQDSNSADVHSARAQLFARLGEKDKADSEYRAALRLAPQDPRMVNNYAVYLCQNGRAGTRRQAETRARVAGTWDCAPPSAMRTRGSISCARCR